MTTVVAVEPDRRLELDAGMALIGASHSSFLLEEREDGCALSIEEHPCAGAIAATWNPVLDGLLGLRDAELLRRVRGIAEGADPWQE